VLVAIESRFDWPVLTSRAAPRAPFDAMQAVGRLTYPNATGAFDLGPYAPFTALLAATAFVDRGVELNTENLMRTGAAAAISGDEKSDAHRALESRRSAIWGSN
jgi:hypothetical protein